MSCLNNRIMLSTADAEACRAQVMPKWHGIPAALTRATLRAPQLSWTNAWTPSPSWWWTTNLAQLSFICLSLVAQALLSIWAGEIKAVALRESSLHFAHHSCFLTFFCSSDFGACFSFLSRKIWSTIEVIHSNMTICYLYFFYCTYLFSITVRCYILIQHISASIKPCLYWHLQKVTQSTVESEIFYESACDSRNHVPGEQQLS